MRSKKLKCELFIAPLVPLRSILLCISASTSRSSSPTLVAMLSRSLSRYQAVAPRGAARLSTAVRTATAGSQAAADALNAPLSATDPELFDIIEHEKLRQARP